MSMAGFFQAVAAEDLQAFQRDHTLIDKQLWNSDREVTLHTDVETTWDVLTNLTGEIGLGIGDFVDHVMSNGCVLLSASTVQSQVQHLTEFTHESLLQKLEALDETADLYHLDVYRDDPEYLLEQFDKLQAFYQQAAAQHLGVVVYLA